MNNWNMRLLHVICETPQFIIDTNDGNITDSTVDEAVYEDLVNMEGYNSGFVPLVPNVQVRDVLDVDVDTQEDLVGGG